MRHLLLFIIVTVLFYKSYAQKVDFMDTSNKWRYEHVTSVRPSHCAISYRDYHYKDSIAKINGHNYHIIELGNSNTSYSLNYFFRRDSLNRIWGTTEALSFQEILLFDFNLQVGDSFTTYIKFNDPFYGNVDSIKRKITYKDSVLINSTWHIVQHYSAENDPSIIHNYTAIEGIGSITGFNNLFPDIQMYVVKNDLNCFYNNGISPKLQVGVHIKHLSFRFSDTVFYNDCLPPASANSQYENNDKIKVYPQPATDKVVFELPTKITGSVTLLNMNGQKLLQQNINNKEKLTLQLNLPPSIYFYRIIDQHNQQQYTGKLIVQ